MRIKIEPNWHQAVVGMTGSGKTTLLKAMIAGYATQLNMTNTPAYYQIFILDTKHDNDFDGLGLKFDRFEDAVYRNQGSRVVIYEPAPEEDDYEHYEMFLRLIWDRWLTAPGKSEKKRVPAVVVIDELGQLEITSQSKSFLDPKRTHYWAEIMKRGRSSNVVLWNATQNPVYMPEDFLRNATVLYCFRLNNPEDRNRMSKYMGVEVKQPITDPHGFWYYRVGGMMKPVYVPKLNITTPTQQRRPINGGNGRNPYNQISRRY